MISRTSRRNAATGMAIQRLARALALAGLRGQRGGLGHLGAGLIGALAWKTHVFIYWGVFFETKAARCDMDAACTSVGCWRGLDLRVLSKAEQPADPACLLNDDSPDSKRVVRRVRYLAMVSNATGAEKSDFGAAHHISRAYGAFKLQVRHHPSPAPGKA